MQHTIFRTAIEHLIMPGKNRVLCRYLLLKIWYHVNAHILKGIIRQILIDPKYELHLDTQTHNKSNFNAKTFLFVLKLYCIRKELEASVNVKKKLIW